MCGPASCYLCDPKFFVKIRTDRVTQLWAILWIPLLIVWILYFSFAMDKLVNTGEGNAFQVQLWQNLPIDLPAWTICSLGNNETIQNITCTITGYNNGQPIAAINQNNLCYVYNTNLKPTPTADYRNQNQGKVSCFIELTDVKSLSKVWIHDPSMMAPNATALQANLDSIPSGICTSVINNGTHTTVHWKKNRFAFENGNIAVGYDRMNENKDYDVTFDRTKTTAFLTIWPGDYFTWNFKEVTWWSGYDFWYFLGMIGGASFVLLMVHQLLFFPLKRWLFNDVEGSTTPSYYTDSDHQQSERLQREESGPRYNL